MKKNISKVLSVMCSVTALAGMFSINSASAMDGPRAAAGSKKVDRNPLAIPSHPEEGEAKVKRPVPGRLTPETVKKERDPDLKLFKKVRKRCPEMTQEEFQKLKVEAVLRDGRPLRPGETLEDRIVRKYEDRKLFEEEEKREHEESLRKLREMKETYTPDSESYSYDPTKPTKGEIRAKKLRELEEKAYDASLLLGRIYGDVKRLSDTEVKNPDGTINIKKFVLVCISKLAISYKKHFKEDLLDYNVDIIAKGMLEHMSERTSMNHRELRILTSFVESVMINVGYSAFTSSPDREGNIPLLKELEEFGTFASVIKSMTEILDVMSMGATDEMDNGYYISMIISTLNKMDPEKDGPVEASSISSITNIEREVRSKLIEALRKRS